jgi:hypothetical protein
MKKLIGGEDHVSGKVEQAVGKVEAKGWKNCRQRKTSQSGRCGSSQGRGHGDLGQRQRRCKEVQRSHKNAANRQGARGGTKSVNRCKTPKKRLTKRSTNSRIAIQPDVAWLRPVTAAGEFSVSLRAMRCQSRHATSAVPNRQSVQF